MDAFFKKWQQLAFSIRGKGGTIYFIGNGASATMASHFSADMAKNAHIHTQVFFDLAMMTAIANDLSYEQVFSEPLSRRTKPHDMLVAISSSGSSPNVVRGILAAQEKRCTVVTLTAMAPDNKGRTLGDFNCYVPAASYGLAETCHAAILHYWMDSVNKGDEK